MLDRHSPQAEFILQSLNEFRKQTIGLQAGVLIASVDDKTTNSIIYEGLVR